jgi:hypothetical protein
LGDLLQALVAKAQALGQSLQYNNILHSKDLTKTMRAHALLITRG